MDSRLRHWWLVSLKVIISLYLYFLTPVPLVYGEEGFQKPMIRHLLLFSLAAITFSIGLFYFLDALDQCKMVINCDNGFEYERNMKINNRLDLTKQHELFGETLPQLCLQFYIIMGTKTIVNNESLEWIVIWKIVCSFAILFFSSVSLNKSISRHSHTLLADFVHQGSPEVINWMNHQSC